MSHIYIYIIEREREHGLYIEHGLYFEAGGGATAAATTAEEVPNFSSLHPITHRDKISRSGTPLTPTIFPALADRSEGFNNKIRAKNN